MKETEIFTDKELAMFKEIDKQKNVALDGLELKKHLDDLHKEQKQTDHHESKQKLFNIRLHQDDIEKLKNKAFKLGIPYQTYLAEIIHKIATGKISIKDEQ